MVILEQNQYPVVHSMHDTTTGEDIFKQIEKTTAECRLQGQQLRRVTTDCGGKMCDTMTS